MKKLYILTYKIEKHVQKSYLYKQYHIKYQLQNKISKYVKGVTSDNFDLARVVEVESKVNFDALSYVTILKRPVNNPYI